ncbi:hypothetical protein AYJ54_12030 [Bradyrhizobium centrolobii]|uniref:Uncharacterized protein n=1 Tax=Bradyrhizobium centrolobii TaxID=1505087 RepID=A0A176YQL3_9BRAD|nr:hypothetical protein [Bradyrhizobium centrolobii]OAF09922.1 hypothetical protein AYJ54_12030 [Bradyrhizobium centrolobii]
MAAMLHRILKSCSAAAIAGAARRSRVAALNLPQICVLRQSSALPGPCGLPHPAEAVGQGGKIGLSKSGVVEFDRTV